MSRVFIEGLPGAGKSTLLKYVAKDGNKIVDELGHTIKPEEFPGNGTNLSEILKIDDWFIEKESARFINTNSFFDRSYLTHLVYSYAYSQYLGIFALEHTVNKYSEAIKSKLLSVPDCVVYVEITPTLSIERQIKRVSNNEELPLPKFWQDINFLENTVNAYNVLFSCMSNIELIKIDGTCNFEHQYCGCLNSIQNSGRFIDLDKYVRRLK